MFITPQNRYVKISPYMARRIFTKEEREIHKKKQLKFWTDFKKYAKLNKTKLKLPKSQPYHFMNIKLNKKEAHIASKVFLRKGICEIELSIPENPKFYFKLKKHRADIEKDLGKKLKWRNIPSMWVSRATLTIQKKPLQNNEEQWQDCFKWMLPETENFYKVFPKYLKKIA